MPQIQEPDGRVWTPLRVVFVALLIAGLLFLATRGFVAAPPPPPPGVTAPAPLPEVETP